MPKLRLLLCCLALLFLAAPAMAEEDELAPGFDRCMEQSGGVTTEMLGCLQQAYEYWDARLNTNYKKARQACKSCSTGQRRFTGISRERSTSLGAWSETESVSCSLSSSSRRIMGTSPQVEREICRIPMFSPSGWLTSRRKVMTFS